MKLLHINVTSAKKHRDELFARFKDYDIWSINESNLNSRQQYYLPSYTIFRNDRLNKEGGGVLLAVRNSFRCYEAINKTIEQNEVIGVQIETPGGFLLLASIYIPPKAKLCRALFDELYQLNEHTLIVGDF